MNHTYVLRSPAEPPRDAYGAPLTCPLCGREFLAHWERDKTGFQHCPSCGHGWEATWPGFNLEPETVIKERAGDEPGHQPDLGGTIILNSSSRSSLTAILRCTCGNRECQWEGAVTVSRYVRKEARKPQPSPGRH